MDVVNGVITFVIVAIVLGLSVSILGNSGTDCSKLDGYNSATPADSIGWSGLCYEQAETTQDSFGMTGIILTVIIAVIILGIVQLLRNSNT